MLANDLKDAELRSLGYFLFISTSFHKFKLQFTISTVVFANALVDANLSFKGFLCFILISFNDFEMQVLGLSKNDL